MLHTKKGTGIALAISTSLALMLTGCSEPTSPEPEPSSATGDATSNRSETAPDQAAQETGLTPEYVVVTQQMPWAGVDIEIAVMPLVRAGDVVVATLDFHGIPEDELFPTDVLSGETLSLPPYSALRLFDLENDQVFTVATDRENNAVATDTFRFDGIGPRIQVAFAAPGPGVETLGLFLPGTAYIEAVPIIEGDIPEPIPSEKHDRSLDPAAVVEAPVFPLESFTRDITGSIKTVSSTEEVEITLGADVLFDVDADTVTKDAVTAIKGASEHLKSRERGTIDIVGHTDDVASADYNQNLSERRAKAVAVELARHIDTTQFPLNTTGKGKTEPLLPNDSAENRALNRRVTLTLTSQMTTTSEVESLTEPPELKEGPTATGAEGVRVEESGRTFEFRAPKARSVDGHIIVDLEATAVDDEFDHAFGFGYLTSGFPYRSGRAVGVNYSLSGVVMLKGTTKVRPMDYSTLR